MKTYQTIFRTIFITISAVVISLGFSAAQNPSVPKEKMSSSIQLSLLKKADRTRHISVKVTAKTKENKREPAKNAHVNFYVQNKDGQKNIDKCITNSEGKGEIVLQKGLPLDTGMFYSIVAKIENDEAFENAEEEIHFKEANLSVKLNAADTTKTVTASVMTIGSDGKEKPVKDVPVKFYVQRMFGIMPAAEDNTLNTDEAGTASFNYPKDIPGGQSGNITVVARIEDNEQFGTVETNAGVNWGNIVAVESNPFPRALWEPHAPPSLILVICILFGGVWITYFYIFYNLYKIKKEKSAYQKEFEAMIKQ